ncbi:MAG: imelysin family protein [Rhodospirillaceae bacterium]|nr:imelysin family protein [Rhodospirillaceae bacterium]
MTRGLIAFLLLVLAAGPAQALTEAQYANAVRETAHAVIVPGYADLAKATAALHGDLATLCTAPDEAGLDQARKAFAVTLQRWARVQFLGLGPIAEHQRAARIEYWPDKRNVVGRQLADVLARQDSAALEAQRFAATSVGVQGLPALERLLFEVDALSAIAADAPGAAFRCALLAAIGGNLETIADEVLAGWTGGESPFLQRLDQPDPESEDLATSHDAAARLLNDLLTATIVLRDMKLLAPLGETPAKAKPQAAEFWRSGQSLAVLRANLEGLRELFGTDGGLGGLLRATPDGAPVAAAFAATLEQAFLAADRITLPLGEAAADTAQRKEVTALAEQLLRLRDLLAGPIAADLNLPIGFNALDGD